MAFTEVTDLEEQRQMVKAKAGAEEERGTEGRGQRRKSRGP